MVEPMMLPGERALIQEAVEQEWPHRCNVRRQSVIGQDDYRQDVYGPWETIHRDVPCEFWWVTGGERTGQRRFVLEYEFRMLVPKDLDIRETDRIGVVEDIDGTRLDISELAIRAVGPRDTAQLVILREVQ